MRPRTIIATAATLLALGGLTAVALSTRPGARVAAPADAVAAPVTTVVRTETVRRTVHVRRHRSRAATPAPPAPVTPAAPAAAAPAAAPARAAEPEHEAEHGEEREREAREHDDD